MKVQHDAGEPNHIRWDALQEQGGSSVGRKKARENEDRHERGELGRR